MPFKDFLSKCKKLPKPSITQLIVTITLLYLLSNNIQSLLNYRHGLKRLEEKTKAINKLQSENTEIKAKIEKTETEEFLYKAAVDQLNLSKPGEKILILEDQNEQKPNNQTNATNAKQEPQASNLQKWKDAFNF